MKKQFIFLFILFNILLLNCQGESPEPIVQTQLGTSVIAVDTVLPMAEVESEKEDSRYPKLTDRQCELFVPAGDIVGETIECGYVIVPADRNDAESNEIKLAYVVLKATGDKPHSDPIIHISGGPGLSSTTRSAVVELAMRYAPMRETRDIILYDQRGIGHSQPKFDCAAFIENVNAVHSTYEKYKACQEGLRNAGYPPDTFTTAVSAVDLLDIMNAFGYSAYNLYGISYGSRLLMSFMHLFPNEPLVRSIILDSVYTLPEDVGTEYRTDTHLIQKALFESVFVECAEDLDCAETYPDLRTRFDVLARKLNQSPFTLNESTSIDGDALYSYFFPYNPQVQIIPLEPKLIAELEQGITTTADKIRQGQLPEPAGRTSFLPPETTIVGELLDLYLYCNDGSVSDTMESRRRLLELWDAGSDAVAEFLNDTCAPDVAKAANEIISQNPRVFNHIISRFVPDEIQGLTPGINSKLNCEEEFPFREGFDEIETNLLEAQFPKFYVEKIISDMRSNAEGCEAWRGALTSPTPGSYGDYHVLVLQGQFDSLTPPAWAEKAVSAIPHAQYVLVPSAWHSILGNNGSCPTNITQQFLANPDAVVDITCTTGMKVRFNVASTE